MISRRRFIASGALAAFSELIARTARASIQGCDFDNPPPGQHDLLLIMAGQSLQTSQGTDGFTPPAAHFALASNPRLRMFNANVFINNGFWDAYRVLANSSPLTPGFYWGPEAAFAELWLTAFPNGRIDIIKHALGGQQLYDNTDVGSFLPGAVIATQKHWPIITAHLARAKSQGLNVRRGYKTVFDYTQGEADALDATKAAAYQANLAILLAHAVSDLSADISIIHQIFGSTTPGVGSLPATYLYCDTVRAAEAAAVAAFGSSALLVDDGPGWINSAGQVHYGPDAIDGTAGRGASIYASLVLPDATTQGSISGTPSVGQTLTYTPAVWRYTVAPFSVAYQWAANGVPILGATGLTYSPQAGDAGSMLSVVETATAYLGSVPTASAPVGPVSA